MVHGNQADRRTLGCAQTWSIAGVMETACRFWPGPSDILRVWTLQSFDKRRVGERLDISFPKENKIKLRFLKTSIHNIFYLLARMVKIFVSD